jgi:hypothetical protein
MSFAAALSDNFLDFIGHYDGLGEPEPLDEYILNWLEKGDAVIDAGGDFGTYMAGVVHIINRWMYNPSITDYRGPDFFHPQPPRQRRADRISEDPAEHLNTDGPLAFSRDHFMSVLYRRMIKGSGD